MADSLKVTYPVSSLSSTGSFLVFYKNTLTSPSSLSKLTVLSMNNQGDITLTFSLGLANVKVFFLVVSMVFLCDPK